MRFTADFITVVDKNAENLPEGNYLQFTDEKGITIYYPRVKFDSVFSLKESTKINQFDIGDIGIGKQTNVQQVTGDISQPNFDIFINEIRLAVEAGGIELETENDWIEILSENSLLLEVPWEGLFNKSVVRVIDSAKITNSDDKKNMLVAISHAHIGVQDYIINQIKLEVKEIYKSLEYYVEENKFFEKILLIKHATISNLQLPSSEYSNYSYLHLAMHCDENGKFWLEKEGDMYKNPEPTDIDDILGTSPRNHSFQLVFFSSCYSGGGLKDGQMSPSHKLVKDGVARYTIGYRFGAKELVAKKFSDDFYKYLKSANQGGQNQIPILSAFINTVKRLGSSERLPIIYASNQALLRYEST